MPEPDAPDEQTIVRAAVADLDAKLPSVQRSRIETTVRRIVQWWLARARVRTFVGIIAARQAREELEPDRPRMDGREQPHDPRPGSTTRNTEP